jgi:hypothetical protein
VHRLTAGATRSRREHLSIRLKVFCRFRCVKKNLPPHRTHIVFFCATHTSAEADAEKILPCSDVAVRRGRSAASPGPGSTFFFFYFFFFALFGRRPHTGTETGPAFERIEREREMERFGRCYGVGVCSDIRQCGHTCSHFYRQTC